MLHKESSQNHVYGIVWVDEFPKWLFNDAQLDENTPHKYRSTPSDVVISRDHGHNFFDAIYNGKPVCGLLLEQTDDYWAVQCDHDVIRYLK